MSYRRNPQCGPDSGLESADGPSDAPRTTAEHHFTNSCHSEWTGGERDNLLFRNSTNSGAATLLFSPPHSPPFADNWKYSSLVASSSPILCVDTLAATNKTLEKGRGLDGWSTTDDERERQGSQITLNSSGGCLPALSSG